MGVGEAGKEKQRTLSGVVFVLVWFGIFLFVFGFAFVSLFTLICFLLGGHHRDEGRLSGSRR